MKISEKTTVTITLLIPILGFASFVTATHLMARSNSDKLSIIDSLLERVARIETKIDLLLDRREQ